MIDTNRRNFKWVIVALVAVGALVLGAWLQQKLDKPRHAFLDLPIEALTSSGLAQASTVGGSQRAVTLVNFWATWCAPCIEEMPALSSLAQSLPKVRFVGIGVDSESKIREFLAKNAIAFPVTASGAAAIEWGRALGNQQGGLPFTVIFDQNGQIFTIISGPIDIANLPSVLKAAELGKPL